MEVTNIVTVRNIGNGAKLVEINGREIPFVVSIAEEDFHGQCSEVTIVLHAAQVNNVGDGEDLPEHTANPRADEYAKRLRVTMLRVQVIRDLLARARWYNAWSTVRQVRDLIVEILI